MSTHQNEAGSLSQLLTINETSQILQVSPSTIRAYVLKRQIPFVKIGKHIRFRADVLTNWIESKTVSKGVSK